MENLESLRPERVIKCSDVNIEFKVPIPCSMRPEIRDNSLLRVKLLMKLYTGTNRSSKKAANRRKIKKYLIIKIFIFIFIYSSND
ncbi:MAG: hypothetical protein FWD78_03970 [Treponema sp.]|nr:hypothetical protein [Treponema sp.]